MTKKYSLLIIYLLLLITACKKQPPKKIWRTKQLAKNTAVHNQLYDFEKEQGWQLLFNGHNLEGWHLYNNALSTNQGAWTVKENTLFCDATNTNKIPGDLVTDTIYENYEFTFDFKVSNNGNSGIFINVQEADSIKTTYQSGPEYQILGPKHMDYKVPTKRPGTLYGFQAQLNAVDMQPNQQWNSGKIIQYNGAIKFYLNGILTAQENFKSAQWKDQVANSGFKNHEAFGANGQGKIALQNWHFNVWYRNLKIRPL